jgi:hypothetical protein
VIPETIEQYVQESGIDLKSLFDPVNAIIYLEVGTSTYQSSEVTPKQRSGFAVTLPNVRDYIKNGFWVADVPKLSSATATETASSTLGNSDFILYGAGYDNNGTQVFEAGFKVDINYGVLFYAEFDSTNNQWNRNFVIVATQDATDDVANDVNNKYGVSINTWNALSSYESWLTTLNVTMTGKGIVSVDTKINASDAKVTSTDGDLKIGTNGTLVLEGNAPVF